MTLSLSEQRALDEIEAQLQREDPAFVARIQQSFLTRWRGRFRSAPNFSSLNFSSLNSRSFRRRRPVQPHLKSSPSLLAWPVMVVLIVVAVTVELALPVNVMARALAATLCVTVVAMTAALGAHVARTRRRR